MSSVFCFLHSFSCGLSRHVVISILLNLCFLWPTMWFILVNVLCECEKNIPLDEGICRGQLCPVG